jgi:uncharacterized protein (DUF488 family)
MPHFAKAALESSLAEHGIRYEHMPELGGLRKPKPDSINTGWRNVSFRGYADYMETDEFWEAIDRLTRTSGRPIPGLRPVLPHEWGSVHPPMDGEDFVAIMCAEAVPWRCHRSLIADALTTRGVEVRHITSSSEPARHTLTPFAQVQGDRITYPPPDTLPI